MIIFKYLSPLLLFFIIWGCEPSKSSDDNYIKEFAETDNSKAKANIQVDAVEVESTPIELSGFYSEKIIFGKLKAKTFLPVKAMMTGQVSYMKHSKDNRMNKGELLLAYDSTAIKLAIAKKNTEFEQALFKRDDALILYGGEGGDISSIKLNKLEKVNIMSGYNSVMAELNELHYFLKLCRVYSQHTGFIVNSNVVTGQYITQSELICNIVDINSFEVAFSLPEYMYTTNLKGTKVEFELMHDSSQKMFFGYINRNEAQVDQNGLIETYIKPATYSKEFINGAQVRIKLRNYVNNVLMVKKQAVEERSGRNVIFTLDNSKKLAIWNFVEIIGENEDYYAIKGEFTDGQIALISGTNSLNHNSKVKL